MHTKGIITLWVRYESRSVKAPFLVSNNLPIPIWVGIGFQKEHMRRFSPMQNKIKIPNSRELPILGRNVGQQSLKRNAPHMTLIEAKGIQRARIT